MATTIERARAWLANTPPAISGASGHNSTFAVCTALVHGFGLDTADAMDLLMRDWNPRCQPPWSERDLARKVNQAAIVPHNKPRGWLLNAGQSPQPASIDMSRVRFAKAPTQPPPDLQPHEELAAFLKAAFAEGEIVCICNDLTPEGKPNTAGSFLTREQWIERHAQPDSTLLDPSSLGAFVRINPFTPGDLSGSDKSVSNLRHVLVEMDESDKATQESILRGTGMPISVLLDSGGKSIHAWVRVDAADRAQWDERRDIIYNALAAQGIDPKNKNPSRYSRLPGAHRSGNRQRLIATRIGADTFENWMVDRQSSDDDATVIDVRQLLDFDTANDPDTLVGNRWLTRGSSMILSGGSGIGKSSLLMQLMITWAAGHPFFGIAPVRPLRIGIVQAENDLGDLAEAFQGVNKGLKLPIEAATVAAKNLHFRTETVRTGADFLDYARRFIARTKLDVIVCDPLLSYFGGDLSNQEAVSRFLRNQLQPILKETKVCWIWIHHIAKPAKDRDGGEPPSLMELAYSGFGSSELTNWAREIAVIQEVGHQRPRKFRLAFCKRGGRLPRAIIPLAHSTQGILWEEWNPGVMTGADLKQAPRRPGRSR